jgi:hypothetical protein
LCRFLIRSDLICYDIFPFFDNFARNLNLA